MNRPPTRGPRTPPQPATAPPPKTAEPTARGTPAALGQIDPVFLPPRIVINAVEGWGKTTCGAYAESPAILMAGGETGYATLLGSRLVPSVDAAVVYEWPALLATIDDMIAGDHRHKTLVLDAIGGFERQCHEFVCNRDFGGDWSEKGFMAYHKGYDVSVGEWLSLLARLDRYRAAAGATIMLLSHCKVATFRNPLDADYDRYVADCHAKTWAATSKWADAVLFGTFHTVVEGGTTGAAPKKGKGVGGAMRIAYTERRDAYDAKNRYGMPADIDIPDSPADAWHTIWAAMTARKDG